MDKIAFLNSKIDNINVNYNGPKFLCKYRPFDDFTFDMLEKKYLYLCPAEKLDDTTECTTSISIENFYDVKNDTLRRECVEQILGLLKPYTSNENYEVCRNIIYRKMTPDFKMHNNFLIDMSCELANLAPEAPQGLIVNLINWFADIPRRIDKPEIKSQLSALMLKGINARKDIGICSLAESSENDDMWSNYADNSAGYCIVYDVIDYKNNNLLFPVIYDDNRQNNIVMQVVATFLGQTIQAISDKNIDADRSQFLRLFTTKNKKWEYQNEWRLIGDSDMRIESPKIKTIIIGTNATKENRNKMIEFCLKNDICYEISCT